jgi:hypothetical protein
MRKGNLNQYWKQAKSDAESLKDKILQAKRKIYRVKSRAWEGDSFSWQKNGWTENVLEIKNVSFSGE